MTGRLFRANLFIGVFILAASSVLLALGVPLMKTWYYCFAWWSTILVLDSLNFRRSRQSPVSESVPRFFFYAFVSVSIWIVFELYNLRLGNWSYHGLSASFIVRWPGYAVAFATVVPGLLELEVLFCGFFKKRKGTSARWRFSAPLLRLSSAFGILCLVLPVFFPRFFFPLVWLGFFFLLEPENYRARRASIFRELEAGHPASALAWMTAGLAAGILWELFNFWAGSHWEYAIPYLGFGKIFQMPILGYGGFVPFALEIAAMVVAFGGLYAAVRPSRALRAVFFAGLVAFDLVGFYLIDTFSLAR